MECFGESHKGKNLEDIVKVLFYFLPYFTIKPHWSTSCFGSKFSHDCLTSERTLFCQGTDCISFNYTEQFSGSSHMQNRRSPTYPRGFSRRLAGEPTISPSVQYTCPRKSCRFGQPKGTKGAEVGWGIRERGSGEDCRRATRTASR